MQSYTTKLLIGITLLAGALLWAGCETDDLIGTEPFQSVSPDQAVEDFQTVEAIALSAYTRNQEFGLYGNTLIIPPDILADNAISRSGATRWQAQANNAVRAHMTGVWDDAYAQINEANQVLSVLPEFEDDPSVDDADITRLRGEMLFTRALAYHNLAKVFGYEPGQEVDGWDTSVVIRTEPTETVEDADDFRPRASNTEVYNQIKDDLSDAIDALGQFDRGSPLFANHEAALALRARVALYESDWEAAEEFATLAMEEAGDRLVDADEYASVSFADEEAGLVSSNITISSIYDQAPNPESIFEVGIQDQSESLGVNDAIPPYLLPAQWQANIPPADFLALFEEGDVRANLYPTDDEENPGNPYTVKYNQSEDQWTDHVPVIRYPELLLIRAEARAEQGDDVGAREDLNTLRDARGASDITSSGADLIDDILTERRLELNFEGHRFFDLKRRGLDIRKPGDEFIDYEDFRVLGPLPTADVELNPELEQNPGY